MHYGTILADGEGNTDIDLSDYGTPGNFFKIKTDAKTDGISSMVWKYYGYPTLDDLYADVVGDNADYSLVEDVVDNTKQKPLAEKKVDYEMGRMVEKDH